MALIIITERFFIEICLEIQVETQIEGWNDLEFKQFTMCKIHYYRLSTHERHLETRKLDNLETALSH